MDTIWELEKNYSHNNFVRPYRDKASRPKIEITIRDSRQWPMVKGTIEAPMINEELDAEEIKAELLQTFTEMLERLKL